MITSHNTKKVKKLNSVCILGSTNFTPNWNNIDGKVNRTSYVGKYLIENGYPLNPMGRTGIRGRGVLGRWGPNHAADPVVTQWKKMGNSAKVLHEQTNKYVSFYF